MPRSKLAMVHIRDAFEGPWSRVNGMKRANVEVSGLGPGEGVRLEYEEATPAGVQLGVAPLVAGSQNVETQRWVRYRVCKWVPAEIGTQYTTVEIFPQ